MGMSIFDMVAPLLAFALVIGIPATVILGKAGYSRAWAVLMIVPIVGLIALWVFAFAKWPALRKDESQNS